MPISSGALGWPDSYFRKAEEEEENLTRNSLDISEGKGQSVWTVQLADRAQFENWKEIRDKKAEKQRRKLKRKKIKEEKKAQKEITRQDINTVLRRRRRQQFCILTSMVTLISSAILIGSIFLFTYYLDEDDLGPAVFTDTECEGKWRTHFLAYRNVLPNGTVHFICCYMPDINASARSYVLQQGDMWPDGYVINQQDCVPTGNKCKQFEKRFDPGTPPCAGHTLTNAVLSVAFCGVIAVLFNFHSW